jgi:hypothetical protein
MTNPSPTFPALLCILLFMAFVVGLAYMGLHVSRNPSPDVRTTMGTVRDPTSAVTAVAR